MFIVKLSSTPLQLHKNKISFEDIRIMKIAEKLKALISHSTVIKNCFKIWTFNFKVILDSTSIIVPRKTKACLFNRCKIPCSYKSKIKNFFFLLQRI